MRISFYIIIILIGLTSISKSQHCGFDHSYILLVEIVDQVGNPVETELDIELLDSKRRTLFNEIQRRHYIEDNDYMLVQKGNNIDKSGPLRNAQFLFNKYYCIGNMEDIDRIKYIKIKKDRREKKYNLYKDLVVRVNENSGLSLCKLNTVGFDSPNIYDYIKSTEILIYKSADSAEYNVILNKTDFKNLLKKYSDKSSLEHKALKKHQKYLFETYLEEDIPVAMIKTDYYPRYSSVCFPAEYREYEDTTDVHFILFENSGINNTFDLDKEPTKSTCRGLNDGINMIKFIPFERQGTKYYKIKSYSRIGLD